MKKTFPEGKDQSRTFDMSQSIFRPKTSKLDNSVAINKQQFLSLLEIPISRLRSEDLEKSREVNDQLENSNVELMKEVLELKKESVKLEKIIKRLKHKETCKLSDSASRSSDRYIQDTAGAVTSSVFGAAETLPGEIYPHLEFSCNTTDINDIDCVDSIKHETLDVVDFSQYDEEDGSSSSNYYYNTSAVDSGWSKLADSGTIRNSRYEIKQKLAQTSEIRHSDHKFKDTEIPTSLERSRPLRKSRDLEPYKQTSDQIFQESQNNKKQVIFNDVSIGKFTTWHKPFTDQKSRTDPESYQQGRTSSSEVENLNSFMIDRSMSATSSVAYPDYLSPVSPTLQSPNTPESPTSILAAKNLESLDYGVDSTGILSDENSQAAETLVELVQPTLLYDSEESSSHLDFETVHRFKNKGYHQIFSINNEMDVLLSQGSRETSRTFSQPSHSSSSLAGNFNIRTGKHPKKGDIISSSIDYEERIECAVEYVEIEQIKDNLLRSSPPALDDMAFECEEFDSDGRRIDRSGDGGEEAERGGNNSKDSEDDNIQNSGGNNIHNSGGDNIQGNGRQKDSPALTTHRNESDELLIEDITHGISNLSCKSAAHGPCDETQNSSLAGLECCIVSTTTYQVQQDQVGERIDEHSGSDKYSK